MSPDPSAATGHEYICTPKNGEVHIIVAHTNARACQGDGGSFEWAGRTSFGFTDNLDLGWARIYINAKNRARIQFPITYAHGMLLHELGHVIGLGHPDARGQSVRAIMNSQVLYDELQDDDIAGAIAIHGAREETGTTQPPDTSLLSRQLILENPRNGSFQSGVGVISGWICDAAYGDINITIVDRWLRTRAYVDIDHGVSRPDTEPICGDTENGFGLLFNWNSLGAGEYEVLVSDEGEGISASAKVTVTTLGEEFLRGAEGEYVLDDFPRPGQSVTIEWEQSLQNFVIKDFHE